MPEVHFVGELEGAEGFDGANVFAKWRIDVHQPHWRPIEGDTSGRTWLCEREFEDSICPWNEPIACSFACSSLSGWPSLLLEVYTVDFWDRVDLGGYGVVRLPTAPGQHRREIVISRPRGSLLSHLGGSFIGGRPRYTDVESLYSSAPRFGHATETVGSAWLSLHCTLKGFDADALPHVFLCQRNEEYLRSSSSNLDDNDGISEDGAAEAAAYADAFAVCRQCPTSPMNSGDQVARAKPNDEDEAEDEQKQQRKTAPTLSEVVARAVKKELEDIDAKAKEASAALAARNAANANAMPSSVSPV